MRIARWSSGAPIEPDPGALAYRLGAEGAADRILLAADGDPAGALAALAGWRRPQLPLGGGDLIALGLAPGPVVAATLQGFPDAARARAIAADAVAQAPRSSQ